MIELETKHIVALMLFTGIGCGAILATTFSYRLREWAFLFMVCFSVYAERFDVNFIGQYWYRGTSRGVGLSLTDVLAWSILVSSLIAPKYVRRPGFRPMGLFFIGLYFAYCIFMTVNALVPIYAVWELANIPRGVMCMLAGAAFIRSRRELGILVIGLAFTACLELLYGVKQRYVDGMYRVPGTLDHSNSLSMYLCTIGPVLAAAVVSNWSIWLRVIGGVGLVAATGGVLLTISRAGLSIYAMVIGGTIIMSISWRITLKKVAICGLIALVGAVVISKMWDQIISRYAEASFAEEYLEEGNEGRGVYIRWAAAIIDDHRFGVGLNNWSYAVSKTYGPESGFRYEDYDDIKGNPEKADLPSINYAAPAHSLAAITAGELGLYGLAIFGLVWARFFLVGLGFFWKRLNDDPMHRMGIGLFFATCGIFLQSVTEWVYRQSVIFLMFHLLMGALASLHWTRKHPYPAEPDAANDSVEEEEAAEVETVVSTEAEPQPTYIAR